MTVAELIAELQKAPPEAKVVLQDADTTWFFVDPAVVVDDDKPVLIHSINDYSGDCYYDWQDVLNWAGTK